MLSILKHHWQPARDSEEGGYLPLPSQPHQYQKLWVISCCQNSRCLMVKLLQGSGATCLSSRARILWVPLPEWGLFICPLVCFSTIHIFILFFSPLKITGLQAVCLSFKRLIDVGLRVALGKPGWPDLMSCRWCAALCLLRFFLLSWSPGNSLECVVLEYSVMFLFLMKIHFAVWICKCRVFSSCGTLLWHAFKRCYGFGSSLLLARSPQLCCRFR